MSTELICIGIAGVRFTCQQYDVPLELGSTFSKELWGFAPEVSLSLSRLGVTATFSGYVGSDAMGRFILNSLAEESVIVDSACTDPNYKTPMVFDLPTSIKSKDSLFYSNEVYSIFLPHKEAIEACKWLILDTPIDQVKGNLSQLLQTVDQAKQAKAKILLNLNLKQEIDPSFQSLTDSLLQQVDVIVGSEQEFQWLTLQTNAGGAVSVLRQKTRAAILQENPKGGCIAYQEDSTEPLIYETFLKDSCLKRSSLAAGFLFGQIQGMSFEDTCKHALAVQTLVGSRQQTISAFPYKEELTTFIKPKKDSLDPSYLHKALARNQKFRTLNLISIDHRSYFAEIATESQFTDIEIAQFKSLVFHGIQEVLHGDQEGHVGFIVDNLYGKELIREGLQDAKIEIIQSIEEAGTHSLSFIDGNEASHLLVEWPRKVIVKVRAYISNDPVEQDHIRKRIYDLYRAVELFGHDLIIDFKIDRSHENDHETILHMVKGCYENGIYPLSWILPLIEEEAFWKSLKELSKLYDPYISIILRYGVTMPTEKTVTILRELKEQYSMITGISLGRILWGNLVEKWLQGEIGDAELRKEIGHQFIQFLDALNPKELAAK
ncbi:MAG: 5-dehydro-2-deoxygluconokinase [Chlamydiales bacterium]